ncbi:MAG: polymer-forming cytoskeletal protein [Bacteroidetes bacterium]|nr:polymer-forming cytoskeletal protein [Bacteroidota bacterium]
MFKSKNETVMVRTTEASSPADKISEGTIFQGDIISSKGIRIDGVIKGSVTCEGKIVVGRSGIIEGDIKCQNAEVEGIIKSSIFVKELLELKSTANLSGEITTGRLSVEPGATFTGSCKMGGVVKEFKEEKTVGALKEKTA